MQKKVKEYIIKCGLLEAGDKVLLGLSGGADSVCLLCLLWELREELNIELSAVHIHHGLRGEEADYDAAYAEELCRKLEVPFLVVYKDVSAYAEEQGVSTEEAGRILRYQVLEEMAETIRNRLAQESEERIGQVKIAVAHHSDDQVETILLNLFRGSGLKGLGGMQSIREDIIRPLLCCSRKEILEYLKQRGQKYCEDSTNASLEYTRNKLRNRILPLIVSEINEKAAEHILWTREMAVQADQYFERMAKDIIQEYGQRESEGLGIDASILLAQPPIVQTYVILEMIYEVCSRRKDIGAKHVEEVRKLIEKGVGAEVDLPYTLKARKTYGGLWIESRDCSKSVDKTEEKHLPECIYKVFAYEKHMKILQNKYTKWFDYGKIRDALSIRTRQTGDYMILKNGGRKTVKSYMIDEKIPRDQREMIPVLAEKNHVLWIVGYRISEYYKVTDETQQVLQVSIVGGQNHER